MWRAGYNRGAGARLSYPGGRLLEEEGIDAQQPTARAYDVEYFATLYGAMPGQTVADKGRELLIRRRVERPGGRARLLHIGGGFGYLVRSFREDSEV